MHFRWPAVSCLAIQCIYYVLFPSFSQSRIFVRICSSMLCLDLNVDDDSLDIRDPSFVPELHSPATACSATLTRHPAAAQPPLSAGQMFGARRIHDAQHAGERPSHGVFSVCSSGVRIVRMHSPHALFTLCVRRFAHNTKEMHVMPHMHDMVFTSFASTPETQSKSRNLALPVDVMASMRRWARWRYVCVCLCVMCSAHICY